MMTGYAIVDMAILVALIAGAFGLIKGFDFFIIKGGLINGAVLGTSLYGFYYWLTNGSGLVLGVSVIAALIGGFNLYFYFSGKEQQSLEDRIRKLRGK